MQISQGLDDFLNAKLAANRKQPTINKYKRAIGKVLRVTGDVPLTHVQSKQVRRVMARMRERGLSASTMETYYIAIKAFFTWCSEEYEIDHNPMQRVERPSVPRRLPPFLTTEEVQRLFWAAKHETRNVRKNLAILTVFLDTGIRRGELCNLRISDIDLPHRQMRVFGKDQDERLVPFSDRTTLALIAYWSGRVDQYPSAFHGLGGSLTTSGVSSIIRRLGEKAGIDKSVRPHLLRHTFAHRWITGGGDLESLRRILGHGSLAVTQRYAGLAIKHIKAKHESVNPLRDID